MIEGSAVDELELAAERHALGDARHPYAFFVHEKGIRVTRIAQGVPLGGELEFVDSGTLDHAIGERQSIPVEGDG